MEDLKTCTKCKQALLRGQFSKNKAKRDGLHGWCKICWIKYRAANSTAISEYNSLYRKATRPARNISKRKYRQINRHKDAAGRAVWRLVAQGLLSSPWVCESCHIVAKLHAHHNDYARPLEVRWMCSSCHKRWHALHGEAPNGAAPWYYPTEKRYKLRKKALRAIIAALPQNKEKQL